MVGFLRGAAGPLWEGKILTNKENKIAVVAPEALLLRQNQRKKGKTKTGQAKQISCSPFVSQKQQDPLEPFPVVSWAAQSYLVEASTKLTRRKRGEAVPFFDDKGGVRRVISSELLATSLSISFVACFPLKKMCSCLLPTPCNPNRCKSSTKVCPIFSCPHGFLAQDVHGGMELRLSISSRGEVKCCADSCMLKRFHFIYCYYQVYSCKAS